MTIGVNLKGARNSTEVEVSDFNELFVTNRFPNESKFNSIADANAYNFATPIINANYVLQGVICNAEKSVTSSAIVDIYEATAVDSTVIVKSILRFDINKLATVSLSNLNIIINKGVWLNAKADDVTVNLTLLGYNRE